MLAQMLDDAVEDGYLDEKPGTREAAPVEGQGNRGGRGWNWERSRR